MEHTVNAYDGLRRYFSVLEAQGFYPEPVTKGMLIYTFLVDQIIDGPLWTHLDNDGAEIINSVLRCLVKSGCLVSMPSTGIRLSEPRNIGIVAGFRATEDVNMRSTQTQQRIVESEFSRTKPKI